MNPGLDLAFKKFHQLQSEDGDIGAEYWREVAYLLQKAQEYRQRAEAAEETLRQIRTLVGE